MPEAQGEVDHQILFTDNLVPAHESTDVVARVGVVLLSRNGIGFGDMVPFGQQYAGQGLPVVRKKRQAVNTLSENSYSGDI